jgi:hypothetical protein
MPPFKGNFCARRMLVGAASSFSTGAYYMNRAATARAVRVAACARLGVSPAPPLAAHRVVVFEKRVEHVGVNYAGLCDDVRGWAARVAPRPHIDCIVPALMTVREQLEMSANTTAYVIEVGSTAMGAVLFGRPGASVISITPKSSDQSIAHHLKISQVALFVADVQAWYLEAEELGNGGKGPGALLLALKRAGTRLDLPPVDLA